MAMADALFTRRSLSDGRTRKVASSVAVVEEEEDRSE